MTESTVGCLCAYMGLDYGTGGAINVSASSEVKIRTPWVVRRAQKKELLIDVTTFD
jgi:hypothetical protein